MFGLGLWDVYNTKRYPLLGDKRLAQEREFSMCREGQYCEEAAHICGHIGDRWL